VATSPDALVLAWRLVVDSKATPDFLRHLELQSLREAVEKVEKEAGCDGAASWKERMGRAQAHLARKQQDSQPSALWLAWMRSVHAFAVASLEDAAAASEGAGTLPRIKGSGSEGRAAGRPKGFPNIYPPGSSHDEA
jgi:hypothetical protein